MGILLSVEDTAAVIAGPVHRYVPAGQELELVCLVNLGPAGNPQTDTEEYRQTAVLHWLLDRRLLESSDNGRIQIESGDVGDSFQGTLMISDTKVSDTGNYTCVPSYATPDNVIVHIVTGNCITFLLQNGLNKSADSFSNIFSQFQRMSRPVYSSMR